ncbi:perlucin-like protein [Mytilus galloprovincialis]|uniref:perlucin-like protein n=1 Tax=Mytilus galloprovincialis TaxID=29158 RepID=UPI003F7BA16C
MERAFFCLFTIVIGIVLVAAVSKCPKDWAEFNNECLFFSYDRRNWLDSQKSCRAQNAYLATDDSADKHSFIRQIVSVLDGERIKAFYIGASDQAFEGQWRWLETGVPLKGYTQWGPGKPEPNATLANNQNCMMYYWVDDDLYWTDHDCNDRNVHFICEKQASDFQNSTQIIGRR